MWSCCRSCSSSQMLKLDGREVLGTAASAGTSTCSTTSSADDGPRLWVMLLRQSCKSSTFLNLRNSNIGDDIFEQNVVVTSAVSDADARLSPCLVDHLIYIYTVYIPVFIDVLVHQEITVRVFCEFPGSGSWVVRVVAPWGKLNTTIWSLLIRKMTTLYYHVLYIYVYVYVYVLSALVVLLLLLLRWFLKQQQLFLVKFRCSSSACRSQATITLHRSPKRRRCHEQPRNLMGRTKKTCTPTTSLKGWKVMSKEAKLRWYVGCTPDTSY